MIRPDMAWPPTELAKITARTKESQVWWEGDTAKLEEFYRNASHTSPSGVIPRAREGFKTFFWGKQDSTQSSKKLHAPIAADIAKLSASELFSEPLKFVDPNKAAQDRVDLIFNNTQFPDALFTAGESASALGGSYQRVVWDEEAGVEHAWIDFVDVDCAIPEYYWSGTLKAITFWSELAGSDDRDVWRHFQRYERGLIRHSLFKGTPTNIGREHALADHDATSKITITGTDDEGAFVETGVDELAAAYVPNVLPNPEWRTETNLRYMGRADIRHDLVPIFHSLDRIYSSLDRDFRVAAARMYASDDVLKNNGSGNGMSLSEEQEIFTKVSPGMNNDNLSSMFEFHQPAIRVLEHDQGAELLLRRVLSATGYSPVSFGMSDEVAQTATEATGKKELTVKTTKGKARYWSAALGPLATTCLRIDAVKFKGVAPSEELEIEWPEFARESDEAKSRTVLNWSTSNAASTRTKVAYLNPDWDEDKVQTEADLIDKAGAVPDPSGGFGGGF